MSLYIPDQQTVEYLEYARDERARVPTGYALLDRSLRGGGLAPGDVMTIAARSSVGKTYLLTNIAARMAADGVAVLLISLEMTVAQMVQRLVCIHHGLDPATFEYSVRTGEGEGLKRLEEYPEVFPNLVVYKPDSASGAGWKDFDRAIVEAEERIGMPVRVVGLDFLGLISPDGYFGNETVRIPRMAAEAERWADAHEVSLLLLHQTGRAREGDPTRRNHGHRPLTMEDLHFGGEQNADYIVTCYRPELAPAPDTDDPEELEEWRQYIAEHRDLMYVQLVKNRHGGVPQEARHPGYPMRWEWPSGRIEEPSVSRGNPGGSPWEPSN